MAIPHNPKNDVFGRGIGIAPSASLKAELDDRMREQIAIYERDRAMQQEDQFIRNMFAEQMRNDLYAQAQGGLGQPLNTGSLQGITKPKKPSFTEKKLLLL